MGNKFFQLKSYFSYWLDAVDEHSLHSPFFFDFYTRVVKVKPQAGITGIENLRKQLLNDKRELKGDDPGSGTRQRKISSIARNSVSPLKYSQLYARIISEFKAKQIMELGTSFGINTLYLAQFPEVSVTTFEGASEIAAIAKLTFEFHGSTNVKLIEGNLNNTLPRFLQDIRKVDFVFMDANHRYQPTVEYFAQLLPKLKDNSIVVVDDIHYSAEMERAWQYIRNHRLVYGSADLYRCGILFFDPSLNKQHVILHY